MELGNAALQAGMYGLVGLCIQGSPPGDLSGLKRTSSPLPRDPTLHLPTMGWAGIGCGLVALCQLDLFVGHGGLQDTQPKSGKTGRNSGICS